jgi:hypothetical protein
VNKQGWLFLIFDRKLIINHQIITAMKKMLLIIAMVLTAGFTMAQTKTQPSNVLKQVNFGPVYAGVDFALQENITAGPMLNYDWSYYDSDYGAFRAAFNISGKADYHLGSLLNLSDEWDLYGGVRFGVGFASHTKFLAGIEIGGRWFWNKKWGLNIESVYGNYWGGNIGVTMRL